MPVIECSNGKCRIGSGECIYDTKEKAIDLINKNTEAKAKKF